MKIAQKILIAAIVMGFIAAGVFAQGACILQSAENTGSPVGKTSMYQILRKYLKITAPVICLEEPCL